MRDILHFREETATTRLGIPAQTANGAHMTSLAIALLLIAAFFHASWNLIAKRAETSGGGPIFIWLFTICTSILYTPIAMLYLIFGGSGGITDLRQIGVV